MNSQGACAFIAGRAEGEAWEDVRCQGQQRCVRLWLQDTGVHRSLMPNNKPPLPFKQHTIISPVALPHRLP